jgi:hypothetical protein
MSSVKLPILKLFHSFDLTISEEYQTLEEELICCIKNVMVLIIGETFDDPNLSQFYQIV